MNKKKPLAFIKKEEADLVFPLENWSAYLQKTNLKIDLLDEGELLQGKVPSVSQLGPPERLVSRLLET